MSLELDTEATVINCTIVLSHSAELPQLNPEIVNVNAIHLCAFSILSAYLTVEGFEYDIAILHSWQPHTKFSFPSQKKKKTHQLSLQSNIGARFNLPVFCLWLIHPQYRGLSLLANISPITGRLNWEGM